MPPQIQGVGSLRRLCGGPLLERGERERQGDGDLDGDGDGDERERGD